ncbi:class I SAM-dependent methyltransferase [Terricaulis silvestris]|uniref:Biotin biosynthesis protein BioC n=1 Tax=Terricaulis silvestris TaxID=2686094 RepID=A0A6I6MMN2_9CAUL|nr:class I SAM-dependent methyltransferase [Terricaulis silvestris]QGZ96550.1 biotin biosynthesis protein BioC [Terricaulis silvestris]
MSTDGRPQQLARTAHFLELYRAYLVADVDMTRSSVESMENQWYVPVGHSAAQVIYSACVGSWLSEVRTVLDMPCGHGRILRHLTKLFPDAAIHACDIDEAGLQFCASQFGAHPILSKEIPEEVAFPVQYDCIWVGSLFTHLSKTMSERWLAHLARQLSPTGILITTWHGRWSAANGAEIQYIEPDKWRAILAEYESTGYGYASYLRGHQHQQYIEGDYGISLSTPVALMEMALAVPDVRVFSFTERGWAGHQDVLVLGKPQIMA